MTLLVEAEGGQQGACRRAGTVVAGPAVTVLRDCQAVVDRDPGARVERVRVDGLSLHGTTGTARVHATVADDAGTHDVDEVVHRVQVRRGWRMTWDGRPDL
jgi:hypothetical protein